jgi:hypothetical protein
MLVRPPAENTGGPIRAAAERTRWSSAVVSRIDRLVELTVIVNRFLSSPEVQPIGSLISWSPAAVKIPVMWLSWSQSSLSGQLPRRRRRFIELKWPHRQNREAASFISCLKAFLNLTVQCCFRRSKSSKLTGPYRAIQLQSVPIVYQRQMCSFHTCHPVSRTREAV